MGVSLWGVLKFEEINTPLFIILSGQGATAGSPTYRQGVLCAIQIIR